MPLEEELRTYQSRRGEFIASGWLGLWVMIKGSDVAGPFDTIGGAVEAGYQKYGLDADFMARQVKETDDVLTSARRAVHAPRPK